MDDPLAKFVGAGILAISLTLVHFILKRKGKKPKNLSLFVWGAWFLFGLKLLMLIIKGP